MKDNARIARDFACDCGTTNRFEFETDFDISSITVGVRCQHCGKDVAITLESFFRKNNGTFQSFSPLSPTISTPETSFAAAMENTFDPLNPQGNPLPQPLQEPESVPAPAAPAGTEPTEEEEDVPSDEEEEEISPEEEDALSNLFKNI